MARLVARLHNSGSSIMTYWLYRKISVIDKNPFHTMQQADNAVHYRRVYQLASDYSLSLQGEKHAPESQPQRIYADEQYDKGLIDADLHASLVEAGQFLETYKKDGVVVLKGIVSQSTVRRAIDDVWDNAILGLPWRADLLDKWSTIRESFRDNPWRPVSPSEAKEAISVYPMTGGFGALTMAPAFNLATEWEIRQDPVMVAVGGAILGASDVMVSLDRVSFKMPGQGATEFCHWDSDPFSWHEEPYVGMQGILSLSSTSFRGVPGTHTDAFRDSFVSLYPRGKRKDQYHVLTSHDPLSLRKRVVEYSMEPGDYVVWSNRLLHEARINKTPRVRYAYFIEYFPASHGPAEEVLRAHGRRIRSTNREDQLADWLSDRVRSYETGSNPYAFPSGTVISLHSNTSLMYHPQALNRFCAQFTTPPLSYVYKSGKKQGQTVNLPRPLVPAEEPSMSYLPPLLSDLGKSLLTGPYLTPSE